MYICNTLDKSKLELDMIMSMTGAGKAMAQHQNKNISVFIKTLNSKQIDISTRLAPAYREREIEVRSMLSEALLRGKVEVSISVEDSSTALSGVQRLNAQAIKFYQNELKKLEEDEAIKLELSDEALLRLPAVLQPMEMQLSELDEAEWQTVRQAITEALDEVIAFRRQEGEMLHKVCRKRVENISTLLEEVNQPESERIPAIRQRLEDALEKLNPDAIERGRLEQELIFYIEKLDINEEKDRLAHHLNYYLEVLGQEGSQGKTLGFIAQEIGREINTLGSKSNNAEMQQIVVKMKDELEQIKEQSLNIL